MYVVNALKIKIPFTKLYLVRNKLSLGATSAVISLFGSGIISSSVYADSFLCGPSSSYATCINAGHTDHGYQSNSGNMYWREYTGHNCTNYVAYTELQNGSTIPLNYMMGYPYQWTANAGSMGVTVNHTPANGATAEWDPGAGGSDPLNGHVAYVESVSADGNTIIVSEDNYYPSQFDWRVITKNSSTWPTQFIHFKDLSTSVDTDGDGVIDINDLLPTIPGLTNNRGVPLQESRLSGDFNGDGKQDIAVFYNYGNGQTKLFMFYGNGSGGFTSPQVAWDSGVGNWDWNRMKAVVGDFNNDSKSDISVFYDYGNGQTKLFMFYGNGTGIFSNPQAVWDSGVGNWEWYRTQPVVGDFNGDGKIDIGAFYDYGNSQTKLFMFYGNGSGGFTSPQVAWDSGVGNWEWQKAKYVTNDFNGDSKQDIAALYDYGSSQTKLQMFYGTSTSSFSNPQAVWDSGVGNWDWRRAMLSAGDFNGDSKQDIAALYNYDNSQTKLFIFNGNGTGSYSSPQMVWDSGVGNWDWNRTKAATGDFNGDSKQDIAALYDYGSSQTKLQMFYGTSTSSFSNPQAVWDSGVGNWDWNRNLAP